MLNYIIWDTSTGVTYPCIGPGDDPKSRVYRNIDEAVLILEGLNAKAAKGAFIKPYRLVDDSLRALVEGKTYQQVTTAPPTPEPVPADTERLVKEILEIRDALELNHCILQLKLSPSDGSDFFEFSLRHPESRGFAECLGGGSTIVSALRGLKNNLLKQVGYKIRDRTAQVEALKQLLTTK